ncbi:unnamed protein product [Caenorhabditis angaria]|uniref:Uncharacterized protein n=1 Tax=Caenorhabditis angaria TaxID=860376 RepID=A0A9P1N630_9PELO|nr:unnamed protein product [Caenorhabditis angaria]
MPAIKSWAETKKKKVENDVQNRMEIEGAAAKAETSNSQFTPMRIPLKRNAKANLKYSKAGIEILDVKERRNEHIEEDEEKIVENDDILPARVLIEEDKQAEEVQFANNENEVVEDCSESSSSKTLVSKNGEYLPVQLTNAVFWDVENDKPLMRDEYENNFKKVTNHMKPISVEQYLEMADAETEKPMKNIYKQFAFQTALFNYTVHRNRQIATGSTPRSTKMKQAKYTFMYTGNDEVIVVTPVMKIAVNIFPVLVHKKWDNYFASKFTKLQKDVIYDILDEVDQHDDYHLIFTGPVVHESTATYCPYANDYTNTMTEVFLDACPCRFSSEEEKKQHRDEIKIAVNTFTSSYYHKKRDDAIEKDKEKQREIDEMLISVKGEAAGKKKMDRLRKRRTVMGEPDEF